MTFRRDEVPGCCQGCDHYKGGVCELLDDPTPENRKAILDKKPCRPREFALRLFAWSHAPEDIVQDVMVRWLSAPRERVLEEMRNHPRDARRWYWILRRWLGHSPLRRVRRDAEREAPTEGLLEPQTSGAHEDWEIDAQSAKAFARLADVNAVDVAIMVEVLTPDSPHIWDAAGPGSQATKSRRIALAKWRFMVFYHDVKERWWPTRDAAWIALEERWLRSDRVTPALAFQRTCARLPGVVDGERAWREALYVPGAERSLELLRESLTADQMTRHEKTWRDVLGLSSDASAGRLPPASLSQSSPPTSGSPPSPPTLAAPRETTVDTKTMMALLSGDLDAAETLDALRALTRPEAHADRATLAQMAHATEAARALHDADPFAFVLERKVTALLATLDLRGTVMRLSTGLAGVARGELGTGKYARDAHASGDEGTVTRVPVHVGEAWRVAYENVSDEPVWLLVAQRDDEGTWVLWGDDSHDAERLAPHERWRFPAMREEHPGEVSLVAVGTRRDPKEVAPFLTLDEGTLEALEVVAFQRFELVAEAPDGDER